MNIVEIIGTDMRSRKSVRNYNLAPIPWLYQDAFGPVPLPPGDYDSSVKCQLWDLLILEVSSPGMGPTQ